MHKTLSLGYKRAETEDCKKVTFLQHFFAAKNGGGLYTRHYSREVRQTYCDLIQILCSRTTCRVSLRLNTVFFEFRKGFAAGKAAGAPSGTRKQDKRVSRKPSL